MDTRIQSLGEARFPSPVAGQRFVSDDERILYDTSEANLRRCIAGAEPVCLEVAGPRQHIHFDPAELTAAIVTCGGLCPGLNDVIRGVVMALWYGYGVRRILGVRHGFQGLVEGLGQEPMELLPDNVRGIHDLGGTILGTSRGPRNVGEMATFIEARGIGLLFCIGGDGTLRGTSLLGEELLRRRSRCAVVGIPKTIDNDIAMVGRSFGYETAVEEARKVITCAHVEARAAVRGVGLVKLMGRHAGFIAAAAALAKPDVNVVLIPEASFDLDGEHGLLRHIDRRLDVQGHAVIVAAEGAGQHLFEGADQGLDDSGNRRLGDIGVLLKKRISSHLSTSGRGFALKYIDPSYVIRSVPANSNDSVFCNFLAYNAVHGGMAGKTGFLTSIWNNRYVHVPLKLATAQKKTVDVEGRLWGHVVESTGQPSFVAPSA